MSTIKQPRAIGLDVGTGTIVCAEVEDGSLAYHRVKDAFFKVNPSQFLTGSAMNFGEAMLKKAGANFVKLDDLLYILGDDAFKFATMFHRECLRPMARGVLNPQEPESVLMVKELVRGVLGEAQDPTDLVYYCVPAEPIDADFDIVFHSSVIKSTLTNLGYKNTFKMNEGLAVVYAELEDQQFSGVGMSFGAGMCLRGNTRIPLLNGETKTIKELAEQGSDKKFWVYSCKEDGSIVPGLASNAHRVKSAQLIRVWLDNGKYVDSTEDHKFMMRDGTYKDAKDLSPRDSLMPLYTTARSIDGRKGYVEVKDNHTHRKNSVHRLVYKRIHGVELKKDDIIHHVDFNPSNNDPENLLLTTRDQHQVIHANLVKWVQKNLKGKTFDEAFGPEKAQHIREAMSKAGKNNENSGHFKKEVAPHNKGKSMDESYGIEKALAIRTAISDCTTQAMQREDVRERYLANRPQNLYDLGLKGWNASKVGKTAEELYGVEKARDMKKSMSATHKKNPNKGVFKKGQVSPRKGTSLSPEERQEVSRKTKEAMNQPDMKKRIMDAMHDPKVIEKRRKTIALRRDWKQELKRRNVNKVDYSFVEYRRQLSSEPCFNHKVVRIERLDVTEDVYDLSVEQYHNFATEAGVFVHNCNIAFSFLGMPIFCFSVARAGDWIDQQAAKTANETANVAQHAKEQGIDLNNPRNKMEQAIAIYYDACLDYVVTQFRNLYATTDPKKLPNIMDPLKVVVSGGTAMPKGFIEKLEALIRQDFPVPVSQVQLAQDQLFAVARGLHNAAKVKISS